MKSHTTGNIFLYYVSSHIRFLPTYFLKKEKWHVPIEIFKIISIGPNEQLCLNEFYELKEKNNLCWRPRPSSRSSSGFHGLACEI